MNWDLMRAIGRCGRRGGRPRVTGPRALFAKARVPAPASFARTGHDRLAKSRRNWAMSLIHRLYAIVLALGLAGAAVAQQADRPTIAAASDLRFALEEIAAAFQRETGHEVSLAFGSTGNFARQIREGAPYQMFMAADEAFVLDLAREGFTDDEGVPYAVGRLALAIPLNGSPLQADGTLEDLRAALEAGTVTRFAVANPDHAPYGARAKEALEHAGLWEPLQPVLILGENVSQAAQFALSGSADGGIIAQSLARSPQLGPQGRFAEIDANWHQPLRQRMVLFRGAGPVARDFFAFLQQPAAQEVLVRFGFDLPE